ncbi:lasso peptide isopeptide bond-forming cyclase [Alkalihalobacterium chitinilyticum]|uniref:asparagine synthase (glutamine-hydrolyzing) n=1 Tax=Alkalihalobacterium chitinilyticum TaxID=2980103 RepID=A0ABT5VED4_9BACI|nr:lasso peptide isopeptide bond-forming cyclase [Alkalihalobacterium chitinilyticum]MDE5413808.1 lasso peptide isopeptide bond-forming cyclase [Alkalihalobacterium chitinilyticum]
MSAIAGIYHLNNQPVSQEASIKIMSELSKFPADHIHTLSGEHFFLGCHAQWITSESVGETLPFYDWDRKLAITVDAIIDNRQELFDKLQVPYDNRKSMPDSHLILLSYDKWGEDSPKYLIGDFAFMIWDERKQMFFGARDFSGSRTLYYTYNQKKFAFCSTIEPLLTLPGIKGVLNDQWLAEFLAIAGMIDTADASITPFRDIHQLAPAHSITVKKSGTKLQKYCHFNTSEKLKLRSDGEYIEAFQDIFQKAVDSRLRTHLQVGAQLSGGLDSGSIVAFAANTLRQEGKTLHTFSYIPPSDFDDFTPRHLMPDERPFIRSTVQHVGGIKDNYFNFDGRDPYTEIDDFLDIMEMPYKFFENSFWLKGMFEKASEENIGLLLNGGRGNLTISWGAAIDYYAILLKKFRWLRLMQELNYYSQNLGGARFRRLPLIAKTAFPFINERLSVNHSYTNPMLINPDFAEKIAVFSKLKEYGMDESGWFSSPNIYEQRVRHFEDDFHWNASNTLAAKLSMRYRLWKRDPTNDLRVVRFCLSLPEEQYVQKGLDRALVRRATDQLLPEKIRLNQKVRGVQGADWVHRLMPKWDRFMNDLHELVNDEISMNYLNRETVQSALESVRNGVSPEYVLNPDSKVLMRSLIVHKFIKKFA